MLPCPRNCLRSVAHTSSQWLQRLSSPRTRGPTRFKEFLDREGLLVKMGHMLPECPYNRGYLKIRSHTTGRVEHVSQA